MASPFLPTGRQRVWKQAGADESGCHGYPAEADVTLPDRIVWCCRSFWRHWTLGACSQCIKQKWRSRPKWTGLT